MKVRQFGVYVCPGALSYKHVFFPLFLLVSPLHRIRRHSDASSLLQLDQGWHFTLALSFSPSYTVFLQQKWEDEEYATVEDAMADFELVFSNALLYYRGREDPGVNDKEVKTMGILFVILFGIESMTKIRGALLLKEFYVTSCSGLWRTLNPSNPPSPEKVRQPASEHCVDVCL